MVQKKIIFDEEMDKDFNALKGILTEKFGVRASNTQCLNFLLQLNKEANLDFKIKPKTKRDIVFFSTRRKYAKQS